MTTHDSRQHRFLFKGLTPEEVEASRQKHGSNVLTPPPSIPWWKLFLEKFDDPVIRILIIAAVIAVGVGIVNGHYAEGLGIIIAILLATTLAFYNEFKAKQEFDILNRVNDDVPVKVIRNETFLTVPKKDIVVDDIVILEVGEEVPADGEVLEAVSLKVEEACMTGEPEPVSKLTKASIEGKTLKPSTYPVYEVMRGTTVRDGHGTMQVTAVGDSTEIGKIAKPPEEESVETPLNVQLDKLSKVIGVFGFLIAGMIYAALVVRGVVVDELVLSAQQWSFAALLAVSVLVVLVRVWLPVLYDALELAGREIDPPAWLEGDDFAGWLKTTLLGAAIFGLGLGLGYLTGFIPSSPANWLPSHAGEEFLKYFMISVTVIVVAVPEGLPMSVTLSLAYSMRKMTATNNLVRRMHACETIGAATAICTDKTGTLTLNEMRVHEVRFPGLQNEDFSDDSNEAARRVIEAIAANTTAHLSRVSGEIACPLGNPTECALILWLNDKGIDYIYPRTDFAVAYQWTFSTERKFMATMGTSPVDGGSVLHVKGAPEIVLGRCSRILTDQGVVPLDHQKADIEAELKDYQARGMRTLGFAYRESPGTHDGGEEVDDVARDMIWLGYAAIIDPVRSDVPAALRVCQNAGIKVKVVTGDNSETAKEISRQIGLWQDGDDASMHMTGEEFKKLDDGEAVRAAGNLKILSRARPMDKLRLVRCLQKVGEVIAVTGDGVNDVPALRQAQVGLAMGKAGTHAAKEASDIILLDDSFRSIANAVMWGRSLYENIQRFVLFQLTINVAALGIALLGPFIGVKLPLTVTQMLWVNLIMDTFAALALATEPPHSSVMKRQPRNPDDFIVTGPMAKSIFSVASIFLVFFIWYLFHIQKDGAVNEYDLTKFFTWFVMLQFWNLFNAKCLGQDHSAFSKVWENKGFITIVSGVFVGQVLMVQFGGEFFRTVPLSLGDWVWIVAVSSVVLWVGEIWRLIRRLKARGRMEEEYSLS